MTPLDPKWIMHYVDTLIATAGKLDKDSVMQQAILLRADTVMDLVKAWKEHCERNSK